MKNWEAKLNLAEKALGKSVITINTNAYKGAVSPQDDLDSFGIKDTKQIPEWVVERLEHHLKMKWLTIDKASDKGRAIDTDLHNPITYRLMTGSTSGGPINLLKGINDVAIGTDGGGSVLAPAMSCQLPSAIGAGLDLFVKEDKQSTDGRVFTGSVGVISKNIFKVKEVMECLADVAFDTSMERKLTIGIPKMNSVICPDKRDMQEKVMVYLKQLNSDLFELRELNMHATNERQVGIDLIQRAFGENEIDIIITCEGPTDLFGYGETIPQQFGKIGQRIAKQHGKYLVRAANMCQTTAITIPTGDLASGLVIIVRRGTKNAENAFYLAKKLEEVIRIPEVWQRYFLDEQRDDSRNLN